ncbi:glycoside hydrolase family 57 protein [Sulfurimonas sp. C5]|uniref:glycoside hydrolase family 57 protein n=1 Tax=Sulfurimonas sp. C5 TaxID=3036947 RepID=UPI00245597F1|nr:glycoside hydrolase family 57 protein [Sulfurimonas sp. C5]MDH4944909.1 glycoside hydrolase family 57 protein [Sulfurimonas sp. C5]
MKLSFLWHMHQPDYTDATGVMQLPWVFLHAIKDYYDMPWMVEGKEGIKATFNITPSLIKQLQLYANDLRKYDKFLTLLHSETAKLQDDEKVWIVKICKSSNYETMIKPVKRYKELYAQYDYTHAELIELQVLFILSWCGNYLRQNSAVIQELLEKQRDYNEHDKKLLFDELQNFMQGLFDYYKALYAKGSVNFSTTPLNHPILPLLLDMNNALDAHPMTNIPKNHIPLEDDALLQVQRAQEVFEDIFGFKPSGFWPAEGAVDPKSVALCSAQGVGWIATDEAILFKSLNKTDKGALYHPYIYDGMRIFFRDHYLSDLIGFTYRHKNAEEAALDFVKELQKIESQNSDPLVCVILDAENAWEFYKTNGYEFFQSLYTKLQSLSWCQTVTMDEVCTLPAKKLEHLVSGSWINGEFNTWVGGSEKTRGWELLFMTKQDYEHHKKNMDSKNKELITQHFLAAECSDWFWWYGDDHFSEYEAEFDELFRNHLITIYDLLEIAPPADLYIPITQHKSTQDFWLHPKSDISPVINGKHDSFFEWIGCGVVDETKVFSTMDTQRGPVKKIFYGQDKHKLYFSFAADMEILCESDSLEVIIEPGNIHGKITLPNETIVIDDVEIFSVCDDLLEMSIAKEYLSSKEILIRFEIEKAGKVVQILPSFGELKINIDDDYSHEWFV